MEKNVNFMTECFVKNMNLRILSLIFFVFGFVSMGCAQKSDTDICEVFSFNIKTEKETKLGSFSTVISEGYGIHKPFKIPKTNLYLVAGVFYEDDLFDEKKQILMDSIHLKLLVTSEQKLNQQNIEKVNPSLVLSATESVLPYKSDDLFPITISLILKTSLGKQAFYMTCKQNTRTK